jgi:acetyl esterase/lipase
MVKEYGRVGNLNAVQIFLSMPFSHPQHMRGQGGLEYLLLLGGGVLVATTILLIAFNSTGSGDNALSQFLGTYSNSTQAAFTNTANGIAGISGNPGAFSGGGGNLPGGGGGGNNGGPGGNNGGNLGGNGGGNNGSGNGNPPQILPDTFASFTTAGNIDYAGDGKNEHRMDMAVPAGANAAGPFPAMIMIHGGYWNSGSRIDSYLISAGTQFVKEGFAVFSIDYTLSSPGVASYPQNIRDVACAIRHIKEHAAQYNIDPARIGLYGVSAGGQLALLDAALESNSPLVDPATDGINEVVPGSGCESTSVDHRVQFVWSQAGPADFQIILGYNPSWADCLTLPGAAPPDCVNYVQMFGGTYNSFANGTAAINPWEQASVSQYASSNDPVTVMGQGDNDGIVSYQWTQDIATNYQNAGVPVHYVLMPGADHFYFMDYLSKGNNSNEPVRVVAEPLMQSTLMPGASLVPAP